MRIIAGKYRGRKLISVTGVKTRPTADRVREALFSILGDIVEGSRVLDLFAGTGALGLEALSRGAAEAVLVENDPAAREAIAANIAALGVPAEVIPADCASALARLGARGVKFSLVLADPPYQGSSASGPVRSSNLLAFLEKFAILKEGGLAVIEHPPEAEPVLPAAGWRMIARKKYGRTALSFYQRAAAVPPPPGQSVFSEGSGESKITQP